MVKLYVSLLALTFATSSALAMPTLQPRIGTVQYVNPVARGEYPSLDARDIYDYLEKRDLSEIASSGSYDRRGLEDDEDLLLRGFDDEELQSREYDS